MISQPWDPENRIPDLLKYTKTGLIYGLKVKVFHRWGPRGGALGSQVGLPTDPRGGLPLGSQGGLKADGPQGPGPRGQGLKDLGPGAQGLKDPGPGALGLKDPDPGALGPFWMIFYIK